MQNQKEFAKKIGITQSTLSSYENGNVAPSLEVLIAIATKFHVSTDCLLGISKSEINITSVSDIANFFSQLILTNLEQNRTDFEAYFTSKKMYDLWKEKQLEYYANNPVTQKQYPVLDTLTRLKLRNELM